MRLFSRIPLSLRYCLLAAIFLVQASYISGQTLVTSSTRSNGTRSIYTGIPAVPRCPNTYEYVPNGFDINDETVKYPLIVALPGLGEMIKIFAQPAETPLEAANRMTLEGYYSDNNGMQQIIEQNKFPLITTYQGINYKFIVVLIQCENNANTWQNTPTDIDNMIKNYISPKYWRNIDWNRIYLTGQSVGGGIAWEFLEDAQRASKLAAIVPISPGTKYLDVDNGTVVPEYSTQFNTIINNVIANPNIGVFAAHNLVDNTVDVSVSQRFFNELDQRQTGRSKLNVYGSDPPPPSDHNAWLRAYDSAKFEFGGLNFYQWLLSNRNPTATALLPVTLTTFDAIAASNKVELTWSTASESNSSHFAVERSSNGRDFKEIGRVKSNGNSTIARNYSFTDNAPLSGKNFYRLRMVDLDATFKFSEIRTVNMNGSDLEFSFGPNPVQHEANIRISGTQRARLTITVTDLMGRTLKTMNFIKADNLFTQKINLADLPAGQYVLSVKGENVNFTQRIMKK